ncbi:PQ loop repeat-domain-containing protein [Flagelloscypha sp. PMI_526]|nr:PQ loop repeat-domain-containing protein [Flagelloscypha sp. PMI_526]
MSSLVASNILGWSSIASWVVVYTPQIWENYILQSGEGVSVAFVIIWLLGDLANLFGAILTKLLPTVIILAAYVHTVLLGQIYYYRFKLRRIQEASDRIHEASERDSLLSHNSTATKAKLLSCLVFVFGAGVLAWYISSSMEHPDTPAPHVSQEAMIIGQLLGWASAFLFVMKNTTTHCEGLSPALFFFSIFGNVTYGASILAKSMERDYVLANCRLACCWCTVALDLGVIGQFVYYRSKRAATRARAAGSSANGNGL